METVTENLNLKRQADSARTLRELHEGLSDSRAREYVFRQESLYLSEMMDGQVRTDLDFWLAGDQMVCHDEQGLPVDWLELHSNGVAYARERAAQNPNLSAYIRVAEAEYEESLLQRRILEQGIEATLVTFSLCGSDLFSDDDLKLLGRNPKLRRGFLRVSVFDGQGGLRLFSRSIDGLSAADVAQTYQSEFNIALAQDASTIDILNSPVVLGIADYQLADRLAPKQGPDSYRFVLSHPELLESLMSGLDSIALYQPPENWPGLSEQLRRDIVSSYKRKLDGTWQDLESLAESIAAAGVMEAGTEFFGCDTVLGGQRISDKLGYFTKQDMLKCVTCPNCNNIVDLPENLYDKGILHCVDCKHTVNRQTGKNVMVPSTKKVLTKQPENLAQYVHRLGTEIKYKQSRDSFINKRAANVNRQTKG